MLLLAEGVRTLLQLEVIVYVVVKTDKRLFIARRSTSTYEAAAAVYMTANLAALREDIRCCL